MLSGNINVEHNMGTVITGHSNNEMRNNDIERTIIR